MTRADKPWGLTPCDNRLMVNRFVRINRDVFLGGTAVIAVLTLALALVPQTLSRHARLQVLREHVDQVARLAASVVDGDMHRRLIEGTEATPEARATALAPLLRLHTTWPEAKYVYTMGIRNGTAFFVLDTAQNAAFAQARNLRASPYGEPFVLRAEYASNWLEELAAGHSYVNPEFQRDDYGYFLTGHAPIFDSAHRPAGFVGVDFDLAYYLGEERRFLHIEVATVLGALLLSVILGYVYARYHFRQKAEMQQHYESSMNDSLTGLLNRRGALAAIDPVLARPGIRTHAALLVDIDHFKAINDTHGHTTGDAVISRLASALRACLESRDVPARLGGDEFLIFAPDCDLPRARAIAERLLSMVRAEGAGNDNQTPFGVSVGICVAEPGARSFDLLYRRADIALYQAKSAGKNRYAVFEATP